MSSDIEDVVRKSAVGQVTLHRVSGGIWIFVGAIFFVLALFVKGKPNEEGMRVVAGVLGVISIAGGAFYIKTMTARMATLVELLVQRRSELKQPEIIETRRNGVVFAHSIAVSDTTNRRYRMKVPSEAEARRILANIPS